MEPEEYATYKEEVEKGWGGFIKKVLNLNKSDKSDF